MIIHIERETDSYNAHILAYMLRQQMHIYRDRQTEINTKWRQTERDSHMINYKRTTYSEQLHI